MTLSGLHNSSSKIDLIKFKVGYGNVLRCLDIQSTVVTSQSFI